MQKRIAVVLGLALLICAVWAFPGLAAGGTGPGDALIPTDAVQILAPKAALWYRFDYAGDRSRIYVKLDTLVSTGLSLSVHTPEQVAQWQRGDELRSIGVGGPSGGFPLVWEGRFQSGGTYYVVVRNSSDQARTYRLSVTGDSVITVRETRVVPTPIPNPFATPVPIGSISGGKLLVSEMRGGYFYTLNPDGSGLTRLTTGIDPIWSPDGTKIAFARQGERAGIWVVNADGSNERLVYAAQEVRCPAWSPDGARIVFPVVRSVKPGETFCFRGRCFTFEDKVVWWLREVRLDDGSWKDLNTPASGGTSPTYNVDNNTIAFEGANLGLTLTTSDNSFDPYVIAGDLRITSPAYNPLNITSPAYSPDGTQLVFMVRQNPAWQIGVANADGSNLRLLTRIDPLDFVNPDNVGPAWSPDGKEILFLSNRNTKWELFAIRVDGSNLRQVLKEVSDRIPLNYTYNADRLLSWTR